MGLLVRGVGVEPYMVPSASMAPTLLGHHKSVSCPRCGYPVQVGYLPEEADDSPYYRRAFCPNCGCEDLDLESAPVSRGDYVLVNKCLYDGSPPRRWELAVFRCPVDPARAYVKRVVGLPGETVQIYDGDVYINGEIARKTLDQFKAMRVPVYDHDFQPPEGWACRWQAQPNDAPVGVEGAKLVLNTEDFSTPQFLQYRHRSLDDEQDQVILDDCSFNGGNGHGQVPVHDFMIELDIECTAGQGSLYLEIFEGSEWLKAELPVGTEQGIRFSTRPVYSQREELAEPAAEGIGLALHKKYHLEFAFVDARLTLTVDSVAPIAPLDREAPARRWRFDGPSFVSPVSLGACGVMAEASHVRIYRGVHYTDQGKHAVRPGVGLSAVPPVKLGAGEYFMLGDNSQNSEDSRHWDDDGRPVPVTEQCLLGKPFLVHMPCRVLTRNWLGRPREFQTVDWERVRWLR